LAKLFWAGKEFVRSLIWMLAAFAPLAAILILGAGLPPLGVLAFGGVFVPVLATLITVLKVVGGGGPGDHHRPDSRPNYHPGGAHPGFFGGGGFGGGWCDGGGGGDCGGGGG